MKKTIILSAAALALAACCSQPKFDGPTYLNPNAPVEERVEDALARMTLEEKLLQLNQYTIGRNTVENNLGEAVGGQIFKFINEDGGQSNPEKYATFEYDLSAFDGKNVVLALGVIKGEESGNEDKLCIYSITLN